MIKVPATPAGLGALEELCAAGVTLNVTLIFTMRQYEAARDAVWRGAQRRNSLDRFKSVYSIFVLRVDVYTEKHVPELSAAAQGEVGIVGAKLIWRANQEFWSKRATPLRQEMIFASTGTKKPEDPPWKYVAALAGSDIQTNPPATNAAVEKSGLTFKRMVDQLPPADVLAEIAAKVDQEKLEDSPDARGRGQVRRSAKGAAEAHRREARLAVTHPLEHAASDCDIPARAQFAERRLVSRLMSCSKVCRFARPVAKSAGHLLGFWAAGELACAAFAGPIYVEYTSQFSICG